MAHGPSATETRHLRTLFSLGAAGMLTDGQLLERFASRDGDPAELAFAALVERHGPMVLRVARSALGDEHSAHDAFQATFLILARKARSLWVRDSLGPWLHAVACRVASHSRSLEARRQHHERAASRPEAHDPRESARNDLARAIHEEIERLPHPYRLAVVTCHLEGLTQQEAAHRLGWPIGTLQSRLARGRQKLRERLQRRGFAPSIAVLAGKLAPIPPALLASTAKAAATLNLGGAIAGMIAPTVLAMIETTTKGMLMTKLKLGAVALVMACGLVGSTRAVNFGQEARTIEGPTVPTSPSRPAVAEAPAALLEPAPAYDVYLHSPPRVAPTGLLEAKPAEVEATPPKDIPAPVHAKGWRNRGQTPPPSADGAVLPPLVDTVTDIRPPGFPILLYFYADWASPCRQARQEIDRLARQRYPITSVNIDGPSELVDRYHFTAVPTYILVDDSGRELGRTMGAVPASKLAEFYNETWRKPPKPDRLDEVPALTKPSNPKPWATAARVKIHLSDKEWGFGSGTVIRSTPEESLILTCAHGFKVPARPALAPADFKIPVTVDLFDDQLAGRQPAMVHCIQKDVTAEVVDFDYSQDLGLLRIKPGRVLPASPIVPIGWKPRLGMKMIAVGCSRGNDATAWDTTILDANTITSRTIGSQMPSVAVSVYMCEHRPREGRSGGGLFTPDGYLAGVNFEAAANKDAGLYAAVEPVRAFLDRNKLADLYEKDADEPGLTLEGPAPAIPPRKAKALEPIPPRPVSDQDRRLNDLERKLDQVLKALEGLRGERPGFN